MSNCIFCQIVAGQSPVSMVYQDERCSAFMDIQPVNPGHLLIIPNCHATFLAHLDEETGAQMFRVAQRLAQALRDSGILRCEGVNLFLADGEAAFQEVFHVHLHVIPRYKHDGFGLTFSSDYFVRPERAELDKVAAAIRGTICRSKLP
jgi:histidine triad (HIT) family protein